MSTGHSEGAQSEFFGTCDILSGDKTGSAAAMLYCIYLWWYKTGRRRRGKEGGGEILLRVNLVSFPDPQYGMQ